MFKSRVLLILTLLTTTAPYGSLAACNADNVLRALRRASATSFCSTYTLPPPNQPLPTYVSAFPASRVSSGCSCLNTPTPTPPPNQPQCSGELIRNGNFSTLTNGFPEPWIPAPPVNVNGQTANVVVQTDGASPPHVNVALTVNNGPPRGFPGVGTSIKQNIPGLCTGTTYTLTYSSQISINGGSPGSACNVNIDLNDQSLVAIGPPSGDPPPFQFQTRSVEFVYRGTALTNTLTIAFQCVAPSGSYVVSEISLVGSG